MQVAPAHASTKPIWVLDSTALVSWFKKPETPFTLKSLERLHAEQPIAIPDIVLFELTDYLPTYQQDMFKELHVAKETNTAALDACIEKHVHQSPLLKSKGGPASEQQIEVLLRFITEHPEALRSTYVGRHYQRYTDVQIAPSFAEAGEQDSPRSDAYLLTKGDATHLTDDAFNLRPLRVHISDLLQMGYMGMKDYITVESKGEKASSVRKRFVTTSDFLKRLNPAPHSSTLRALQEALVPSTGKTKCFLTFGDLETEIGQQKAQPLLPDRDAIRPTYTEDIRECIPLEEMAQHTGLLVEHLFYGGIIPETLIPACAKEMGFSANGDERYPETKETLGETLKQEGFFERRVSVGLLKQLRHTLEGIDAEALGTDSAAVERSKTYLDQLCDIEKLIAHRHEILSSATKNKSSAAMGIAAFDPERGTAYEHLFTDALFSGIVSANDFIGLMMRTDALPNRQSLGNEGNLRGLSDGSLFFDPAENRLLIEIPSRSHLGVITRAGLIAPLEERDDLHPQKLTIEGRQYAAYPMDKLLEIATSSHDPDTKQCRRYFRAMLYPAIEQDAMGFRAKAQNYFKEIGKPNLLPQLEHHWLRMHKRYWGGPENGSAPSKEKRGHNMPFFTSPFASLYAQRETMKKNLGELSAAEVAHTLAAAGKEVTIINHDNALKADPDTQRFIGFAPEHTRQMSRFRSPCNDVNNQAIHLTQLEKSMIKQPIRVLPSRELTSRLASSHNAAPTFSEPSTDAGFIVNNAIALGSISMMPESVRLAS